MYDYYNGTPGPDIIIKGEGPVDDIIDGLGGDDYINAGGGNDIIIGNKGQDSLVGGTGADTFVFVTGDSLTSAPDTILDFNTGEDKIDLTGMATGPDWTITLRPTVTGATLSSASLADTINVNGAVKGSDLILKLGQTLSIVGDAGSNVLVGGSGNDIIAGGKGADTLTGGGGADAFVYKPGDSVAGAGEDIILDFVSGQDHLDLTAYGATKIDMVRSGSGGYLQIGSDKIDINAFVQGSDLFLAPGSWINASGTDAGEALIGTSGADRLLGNGGGDILTGGASADTFVYRTAADSTANDPDKITDFATGADKLDFAKVGPYSKIGIQLGGQTSTISYTGASAQSPIGVINVVGLVQATDLLIQGGSSVTVTGTSGADVITGGPENDTLIGGGGADTLAGGGGVDTFVYKSVTDSTFAAPDKITDFLTGVDKIDLTAAVGAHGQVTLQLTSQGGLPNTVYYTGANAAAGTGVLLVDGVLKATDLVTGSGVHTSVYGTNNSEFLGGTKFDDSLFGKAGDDALNGGLGNDVLDGGDGIDTAVFSGAFSGYTITQAGVVTVSGPDGVDKVSNVERYQFADGTIDTADGAPLVDDLFYDAHYGDIYTLKIDPDAHYDAFGWQEGRDPSAFFSTSGYLAANADIKSLGLNPLQHYDQSGWKEGRDPSADFDTTLYLQHNPDVVALGMDPLAHYLQIGRAEGREAYAAIGSTITADGFDAEFYLLSNPDVAAAGIDPYQHYMTFGWKEGRNPNAFFDDAGYLARYTDVAQAGLNPLTHYHLYGWMEGRDPSAHFDTQQYEAHNSDIAALQVDPLVHYLQYGAYENRSTCDDGVLG